MIVWTWTSKSGVNNSISFACGPCLKGHRSNGCAHWERLLVEVKGKGRPVSQCSHCRTRRAGADNGSDSTPTNTFATSSTMASPSMHPPLSESKKSRAGHSHHKCLCGIEAAARAKRTVEAKFYSDSHKGRTAVTLSFVSTDHVSIQAALEAGKTSTIQIQQTGKAASKSAKASASSSSLGDLMQANASPSPSPSVSSPLNSAPPIDKVNASPSMDSIPSTRAKTFVETETLTILFDSMKVSSPEPLSVTFVNPCSCAFGGACICGDLSLKKTKAAGYAQPVQKVIPITYTPNMVPSHSHHQQQHPQQHQLTHPLIGSAPLSQPPYLQHSQQPSTHHMQSHISPILTLPPPNQSPTVSHRPTLPAFRSILPAPSNASAAPLNPPQSTSTAPNSSIPSLNMVSMMQPSHGLTLAPLRSPSSTQLNNATSMPTFENSNTLQVGQQLMESGGAKSSCCGGNNVLALKRKDGDETLIAQALLGLTKSDDFFEATSQRCEIEVGDSGGGCCGGGGSGSSFSVVDQEELKGQMEDEYEGGAGTAGCGCGCSCVSPTGLAGGDGSCVSDGEYPSSLGSALGESGVGCCCSG
ncbi:hypothetical protein HDU80_010417 [Chytriomyces hyalinus]|nr:hypothetical protein HDU80_010417 [Chytriomyces hyalinus]